MSRLSSPDFNLARLSVSLSSRIVPCVTTSAAVALSMTQTPSSSAITTSPGFTVAPPPQTACCDSTIPANGDLKSSISGFVRTGSVTFETEIQARLASDYQCSIKSLEILITPVAAEPVVTSTNPVITTFANCDSTGASIFSSLWTTFAGDPAGGNYTIVYTYKDSDGLTVATYTPTYTLNF